MGRQLPMVASIRFLQGAIALVSTALTAALLMLGLATYQHAQNELVDLIRVVGKDTLLIERDWSQKGIIVTPEFETELQAFTKRLDGFRKIAFRASRGKSPNRFQYYAAYVTPAYFEVLRYPLARGRIFAPGAQEAVVGRDHAELFNKMIIVRGAEVPVVGVLESVSRRGGPDRLTDGTVFVPFTMTGTLIPTEAVVLFESERQLEAARKEIAQWLKEQGYPYSVTILASRYGLELRNQLRKIMGGALLWGLLAALLAAGANLSTYGHTRALERVRELGIRRAVGANARDTLRELLIETLVWALSGLAYGTTCAFLLSGLFSRETGLAATPTLLSIGMVALGLVLITLSAAYPAARWAARQPPAGAIRGATSSLPQKRLGLAFIGLAVGIAAFGAQLGIVHSANEYARKMVGDISNNSATYTSFLYLRRYSMTDPRGATPLNYEDYQVLRESDLADALHRTAYVEHYLVRLAGPKGELYTYVSAYEGFYPDIAGARIVAGSWPRASDKEVAVGRELVIKLFGDTRTAFNSTLTFLGHTWRIAGVYEGAKHPLPGNLSESQLVLPRGALGGTLPRARAEIMVEKKPGADDSIFDEIGRFLTMRHANPDLHPVVPLRKVDFIPEFRDALARLAAAYRMLAAVILLLAGVGLAAQTLMIARLETRTLGVRRAVGGSRIRVFAELLWPLLVAALLAGAVGTAAGAAVSYIAVRAQGATWSLPWVQLLFVALASPLWAAVFAALPAWQAASVPPAEAMRSE